MYVTSWTSIFFSKHCPPRHKVKTSANVLKTVRIARAPKQMVWRGDVSESFETDLWKKGILIIQRSQGICCWCILNCSRGSEGTDVKLMAPLDVRAKALAKHREMNGFMSFFGGSVAVQVLNLTNFLKDHPMTMWMMMIWDSLGWNCEFL